MSYADWIVRPVEYVGTDWCIANGRTHTGTTQYITVTGKVVQEGWPVNDQWFKTQAEAQAALDKYLGKVEDDYKRQVFGTWETLAEMAEVPHDKLVVGRKYRIEWPQGEGRSLPEGCYTIAEITPWLSAGYARFRINISGFNYSTEYYKFYEVAQDPTPKITRQSMIDAGFRSKYLIDDAAKANLLKLQQTQYSQAGISTPDPDSPEQMWEDIVKIIMPSNLKQKSKQKQEIKIMFKKALHRIVVVWCLYGLVRFCIIVNPLLFLVHKTLGIKFQPDTSLAEQTTALWIIAVIIIAAAVAASIAVHKFSNWFFNTPKK